MFKQISKLLTKVTNKVMNLDDYKNSDDLQKMLTYKKTNLSSKNLDDFLYKLKQKHLVNDIIITDLNGMIIGSTNKDFREGFKSSAMYNYINSEIKELSIILLEANGWQIIFKNDSKVYFIKANDSLTKLEVLAIVNDLEGYLKFIE